MKELLTRLCDCLEKGKPVALASVIAQQGSTPRGTGSRLLADADGLTAGTIGGGLSEARTLEACRAALHDGQTRILDFMLDGELAAKSDMICGGRLRVLIEPLFSAQEHLPFFQAVREALHRDGVTLITDVTEASRPRRMACIGDARIGAPLPEEVIAGVRASDVSMPDEFLHARDGREYFIERCLPPVRMIIAGGGHVSRPTAQIAALAGFEVTVLDDRPEFSQAERFPWATRVATVPDFAECFADHAPNFRTYVVIVTRGHVHDATVLAQALATGAGYIGMIGSKRKRAEVYTSLRKEGASEEGLARVHCPIGLAIGAETPEEIAVSIVAECVAHRRKACPLEHMPR